MYHHLYNEKLSINKKKNYFFLHKKTPATKSTKTIKIPITIGKIASKFPDGRVSINDRQILINIIKIIALTQHC